MTANERLRARRTLRPALSLLGLVALLGLLLMPTTDPGTAVRSAAPAAPATAEASETIGTGVESTAAPVTEVDGYTPAEPVAANSGAAPPSPQVIVDQRPGARTVKRTIDHPSCGKGFTLVEGETLAGFCIHTANDPLPPLFQGQIQNKGMAPVCRGNGINGPRIQLIYIYVEGQPNRSSLMVPRIANEFVPRMEAVFRETSKSQGRELGLRLHMPGCKLKVDTLMIDEANGQPDNPGTMLDRIIEFISDKGYSKSDRKYIVWFDGGNKGACGVAATTVPLAAHATDNAVAGQAANVGWQAFLPVETALVFRYGVPLLGEPGPFRQVRECWGQGGTGARTEIHELIHSLGAVGKAAPNSNGFGHCVDDHDIMCYGEQGVMTKPRCAVPVELLDCGADDYFNARPSAGSYLSTHWNTANSKFLGDAIVHDAVPAEIPRP